MRIGFVFYDAGGGHRAAAAALCTVIQQQRRPWELKCWNLQEILDPLDPSRKLLGLPLQELYNLILKKNLTLGAGYLLRVLHALIRIYHRPAVRLLKAHFQQERPDLVVSLIPHFNRALFEALKQANPRVPFVTILTDFADHPPHFWIEQQPQYFVCGSEHAIRQAAALGHPQEVLYQVSGMILHPRFYEPTCLDRRAERRRLGLAPDTPTALVLFGGAGSRVMHRVTRSLDRSGLDVQLILLCGHDGQLARQLKSLRTRIPLLVEGFTNDVPYFMRLADFFIGKPGPGSISEALAMKLPVVVASNAWTLPHERFNAAWVQEKQVGLVVRSFARISEAVARLIEPENYRRFRANAAATNNRAVFEVPEILAEILERGAVA